MRSSHLGEKTVFTGVALSILLLGVLLWNVMSESPYDATLMCHLSNMNIPDYTTYSACQRGTSKCGGFYGPHPIMAISLTVTPMSLEASD